MPAPKKPAPKKAGRPPTGLPKARNVNTTIPPDVHDLLAEHGQGSASRGMRLVILAWAAKNSARANA